MSTHQKERSVKHSQQNHGKRGNFDMKQLELSLAWRLDLLAKAVKCNTA